MKTYANCSFCGESSEHIKMLESGKDDNGTKAYICHLCVKLFHARFLKWVKDERTRMADEAFAPSQSQGNACHESEDDAGQHTRRPLASFCH